MNRIHLLLSLVLLVCSGCAVYWKQTAGEFVDAKMKYGLTLTQPSNWYLKDFKKAKLYTRNGVTLEYIALEKRKWKDTLSYGNQMPAELLLQEIPEILLGEMCAGSYAFDLQILSSRIVLLDGVPCAVTEYCFISPNSLKKKGVLYCIPFKKYYSVLEFTAESSHYFDESYKDFTAMVSSIVVNYKKYLPLPGVPVPKNNINSICLVVVIWWKLYNNFNQISTFYAKIN